MENKKILIVDDFDAMRKIIKDNLLVKGIRKLLMAENGQQALDILKKNSVDLIITDWNMPKMTGIELIREIRKIDRLQNIPVLMITAETTRESIDDAISVGINEFMVKPFTPFTLYSKIDSIFAGKSPISSPPSSQTNKQTQDKSRNNKPAVKKETEILVVDDLPANIDVIVGILSVAYKIRVATSGKRALKIAISNTPPDLILLDIMMPEMDGFEVCRRLKENPMTANIPVIFLTAKSDVETTIEGFELGAVDYINKPVEPALLRMRVKNHLDLKFSKDELRYQVDGLMETARLREDVERISRHDLKNPLGLIINKAAQILNDKFLPKRYWQQIQDIEVAGTTILNMVNSSLNLYKMETNSYHFEPVNVDIIKVISKVEKDMKHILKENNIDINITADSDCIYIKGEELLCYSIFSNLIKNAVEASICGESIEVSVAKGKKVMVVIHNPAVIPESVKDHFFIKYATANKSSGTGIGTYSAKLMVEVQEGSLTFTSSAEQGTRLFLEFPAG
jgi:PleD family two-component response regulator